MHQFYTQETKTPMNGPKNGQKKDPQEELPVIGKNELTKTSKTGLTTPAAKNNFKRGNQFLKFNL